MTRRRVTIKQVAQEAGVSTQTISRVINNRPDVAPETRRRVQEVIRRLGYQPSALARSLIRKHSYSLGVVTAGLRYVGPSRTLNGIIAEAEAQGYSLLLKKLSYFDDVDNVEGILNSFISRQVDGIIWAVPEVGSNREWLLSRLPRLPVPIIFLSMHQEDTVSVVAVDNYMGGRIATEHLIEQGCRHIGHISGPLAWWEARQRLAGWQDTLLDNGLHPLESHWVEGNWSVESGERAFLELMEQYPEMDAVFVANDQMALGVLYVACQRGIQIPGDLAVVGFDGIPETAYFWPPLSTVHQDMHELGATAARQVIHQVESSRIDEIAEQDHHNKPRTIWLKPRLIVRDSSRKL